MATILIVDDEVDVRETVKMILDYEGYATVHAGDGAQALSLLAQHELDAVLLDIKMPGRDGMEILEEMRRSRPDLPVIMISGHGTISTAVEATKKGAFDFIAKPFKPKDLRAVINKAALSLGHRGML